MVCHHLLMVARLIAISRSEILNPPSTRENTASAPSSHEPTIASSATRVNDLENNDNSSFNDSRNETALSAEIRSIVERMPRTGDLDQRYRSRSGANVRFDSDSQDDEDSPG